MNQREKLTLLYKQIEKNRAETNKVYKKNMEIFNMNTSSLAQLEADQAVSASVKNLKNISPITSRYQYLPQNNNGSARNMN